MSKKKLLTAVISLVLVIAVALPGTLAVSNATATGETPATTAPAEEVKCTCGAAEGEAHAATCALNNIPTETQPTEGEPTQGETPEQKTCTCEAPEGEPHKEGCPLYVDPNAPAETTDPATDPAEGEGTQAPEVLTCTCDPVREEGQPHESTCPLYEGPKHIGTCSDDCSDENCTCGCHLFNKIMACTTLDDIWALLDSATEEELKALTEEQNQKIDEKITALEPEPAPAIVIENTAEGTVQSEIYTPTRDVTNVAPFRAPVTGSGN